LFTVTNLSRSGLQPFSFTLSSGECVAVRGASGSGKSLLMRALADLDPSQGEVILNGIARSVLTGPEWRRKVGYVSAEPGWWTERIAAHFSDLPRAKQLAAELNLSADVFDRLVSQASTGERLRLGLVRALCLDPQVLLLDEPTAALDQTGTQLVEDLILRLLGQGMAVLWTTHDPAQASRMARRTLIVADGSVTEQAAS